MSNCSDGLGVAGQGDPGRTPLTRLLLAMADEWTAIADAVGTLGGHVAEAAAGQGLVAPIRDLQAFDTIGQRAHGQAKLLTKLARMINADPNFDPSHLPDLLAHIPFEHVRASLKAACHGTGLTLQTPAEPAEGVVDWF